MKKLNTKLVVSLITAVLMTACGDSDNNDNRRGTYLGNDYTNNLTTSSTVGDRLSLNLYAQGYNSYVSYQNRNINNGYQNNNGYNNGNNGYGNYGYTNGYINNGNSNYGYQNNSGFQSSSAVNGQLTVAAVTQDVFSSIPGKACAPTPYQVTGFMPAGVYDIATVQEGNFLQSPSTNLVSQTYVTLTSRSSYSGVRATFNALVASASVSTINNTTGGSAEIITEEGCRFTFN